MRNFKVKPEVMLLRWPRFSSLSCHCHHHYHYHHNFILMRTVQFLGIYLELLWFIDEQTAHAFEIMLMLMLMMKVMMRLMMMMTTSSSSMRFQGYLVKHHCHRRNRHHCHRFHHHRNRHHGDFKVIWSNRLRESSCRGF